MTFEDINVVAYKEGGNTTELDAVLRSHIVKHWKNGKFYVVTASRTTENPKILRSLC